MAWILTAVTVVSGYILLQVTRQMWVEGGASEGRASAKEMTR
jgi:hypothetical protein